MFYVYHLQRLLVLAKPCLEKATARMDTAVPESVSRYYGARRQCQLEALQEDSKEEQQAKYESCLKTAPAWPTEHMKAVCLIQLNVSCLFQLTLLMTDESEIS